MENFKDWKADRRGSVSLMTGLTLPILIGIAGLAVETSLWNIEKNRAQTAADFAAHAAAIELAKAGPDQPLADAVAISQAKHYGYNHTQLVTGVDDAPEGLRIDVSITHPVKRYFSRIFDNSELSVSSDSSAIVESAGEACLVALDPNGDGVNLGGSTGITLNNCLVASNSEKSNGFEVGGSASLAAACGGVVGGSNINESAVTFSDCKKVREGIIPVIDPYADIPMPTPGTGWLSSCVSAPNGGKGKGNNSTAAPLTSGLYCGGLTFSGTQEIEDGATLVIAGGRLKNQGQAKLVGKNVTIILMNDAQVFLTSQANMDLTAKTSGDYAGLIFAGDKRTQSTTHRFAGGSDSHLSGAVYLPTDTIDLRGGASVKVGCLHYIAAEIDARGNSDMSNSCDGVGTKPLVVTGGIRMLKS